MIVRATVYLLAGMELLQRYTLEIASLAPNSINYTFLRIGQRITRRGYYWSNGI